ncbi:MAG: hypothetical protein J3K34DRAFT_267236 [Monoraphidium minutum]|nr:MAG: hypothetical protein J3K34DRAFT_267236 [Monoraphidium minutum]
MYGFCGSIGSFPLLPSHSLIPSERIPSKSARVPCHPRPPAPPPETTDTLARCMAAESLWTGDQPLQQGAGGAANAGPRLRFSHECRRFGCWDRACSQCRNNPLKTCQPGDHFCEVYAQDKPLCAKCGAAVQVVLEGAPPGALPAGAAVLLTVVDGSSGASVALVRAEDGGKVSKRRGGRASRGGDDAGDDDAAAAAVGSGGLSPLLACDRPGAVLPESGALLIPFQDGAAHLPAVRVTRPVSTVTCPRGARLGPLVLIARAVAPAPGGGGRYEEIVGVAPAASGRFVSKSQRAVDDYTKDPFPALASGDLRRVRHVGEVTERRLKANARAADVLGSECPLERVTTVAELRAVVRAARTSPNLHARLVALLNVKGRRSLPLDELSDILEHCTVEEDDAPRLWLPPAAVAPPGAPALGLLFNARRGAAAFERPAALVLRGGGGGAQSPALSLRSGGGGAGVVPPEAVAGLLSAAMDGWWRAGHPGWQRLEGAADLVYVDPATFASAAAASGADAPAPLRALLHGAACPTRSHMALAAARRVPRPHRRLRACRR